MRKLLSKKELLKTCNENVDLSNEGIDRISELLVDALELMQVNSKDVLRLRLEIEEILLMWKAHIGTPSVCRLSCGERFGRPYIYISLPGARMDPVEICNDEDEFLYSSLLAQSGIAPAYDYIHGENRLSLTPSRDESSSSSKLLLTIGVATVLGILCRFLPVGILSFLKELSSLLLTTFTGVLSAVAAPLIFLSIIIGIINIGDFSTFKRIGKILVSRLFRSHLLILLIAMLCSVWFFLGNEATSAADSGSFMDVFKILLDIVPENLFAPFVSGNTLQIIFLAVCFGIALLILGNKVSLVQSFVFQSDMIIKTIMEFLGKNIEVLIFISLLSITLSVSADGIGALMFGMCIAIALDLIVPLVYTLIVSVKLKMAFSLLLGKLMPSYLLALSTSSSTASLSTVLETCEKKLGIHRRIAYFAIPLSQIIMCVGSSIGNLLMVFVFSNIFGIAITLSRLLIIFVVVLLLSIATPPVPGGGIAIIAIIFAQIGIPEAAVTVAIAFYLITDHFNTGCSVACMQAEVLLTANKLSMVDRDILLK